MIVWIGGALSFVVNVLGIVSELPELIKDNADNLPQWLLNPKFLWVVIVTGIYAVFALLMWPRQKKNPVPWIQEISDRITALTSHLNRLAGKYPKGLTLNDLTIAHANEMCKDFGNDLAIFIGLHLGIKEREAYQKRLQTVTSVDPKVAAGQTGIVAMQWMTEFIAAETRKAMKQASEGVKLEIADYSKSQTKEQ